MSNPMFVPMPIYSIETNLLQFHKGDQTDPLLETFNYDGRVESEITAFGFCNFFTDKRFSIYRTVMIKFYTIEGSICGDKVGYITSEKLPALNAFEYKREETENGSYFYSFSGNWVTAEIYCSNEMFRKLLEFGNYINSNFKTTNPYQLSFSLQLARFYRANHASMYQRLKSIFVEPVKAPVFVHHLQPRDKSPAFIEKITNLKLESLGQQTFTDFLKMKFSLDALKKENYDENKLELVHLIELFGDWLPKLDEAISGDEYKMLVNHFKEEAAELRKRNKNLSIY